MNQHYLAAPKREALAQRTGLSFKQITSWFEYRRARNKKNQNKRTIQFSVSCCKSESFPFFRLD
ncbi:hypothetical protein Mgra_00009336, partial [Meloidogyne graminicola]